MDDQKRKYLPTTTERVVAIGGALTPFAKARTHLKEQRKGLLPLCRQNEPVGVDGLEPPASSL